MAVQDLPKRSPAAPPLPPSAAHPERNPGTPLELDWVREVRVNTSAAERRAATLPKRRTVKKEWQAAWYLRAITCMDLTTLSGDDTPGRVRRLCAKARQPVRAGSFGSPGRGAPGHPGRLGLRLPRHDRARPSRPSRAPASRSAPCRPASRPA